MKNIFLVLFTLTFIATVHAEAGNCSGYLDPRDYQAYGCGNSSSSSRGSNTRSRSRTNSSSSKSNQNSANNTCNKTCPEGQEARMFQGSCDCFAMDNFDLQGSNTNPGNGSTPNSGGITSSPDVTRALNACTDAKATAMNDCDQDQDTGMKGAQSTLTNFAVTAGQMGIAAVCTKMATLLAGANGAVIYFQQSCDSSRTKCMQTCQASGNSVRSMTGLADSYMSASRGQVDDAYDACKKLDVKIAQSGQAIQNILSTVTGAQSCATNTSSDLYNYCTQNPTAIGCETVATDCSNPTIAASNQICICKANPSASGCTGAVAKDLNGGYTDSASSTTTPAASGSGIDTDSMLNSLKYDGNGMTPSQGTAEDPGGKKGGAARLGDSSGGGMGGDNGGKPGASPAALAVNAGFRGGSGGGGGWGSGGGNGGGGGYDRPEQQNPQNPNGPNLRDFLPNGKLDPKVVNRGLAGISGPDGITGPHSDLWKKVQNRYQVQMESSKLMP